MKTQDLQRNNNENQYDKITTDHKRAWLEKVEKKQQALEDQGIKTNVLYDKVEAVKAQHRSVGIDEISTYDALAQIFDYEERLGLDKKESKTETHIL